MDRHFDKAIKILASLVMKKFSFVFILFLSFLHYNVNGQCWTTMSMAGGYPSQGGHTLALKSDGTLWSWGSNSSGQLGVGNTTNYITPVQVGTATSWVKISTGNEFSAAIKSNGTLWMWGSNSFSQLGDGTTVYKTTPTQIGTATWSNVYCGHSYVIAIKSDGTLWSWGSNGSLQLGSGTPLFQAYTTPHQISTTTGWSKIATGYRHVLALKTNGTLWYWGNNSNGQLGNNSTVQTPYITQLGTLTTWTDIAAGNDFSVALKSDGSMWTWGYNLYGQLGNGNNNASLVPIQVGVGSTWSNVEAGYSFVIAKKSNNTLWSFGQNALGYLGLGNTTNYNIPTQIGASATWQNIYVGYKSAIATQSNLNFYGWGSNTYGQLGDATTTYKLSPTLMPYTCVISDVDQDGYTVAQGDCNDNNAGINPGLVEVFSNNVDENCDGIIGCEVALTDQPNDVFAPIGGIANFTLNISSANSGVSYQWQTLFNGQWINLFNAGQYTGANMPSLAVNNLNQNNYGNWFRCYLTSAQNAFCPTYSDSVTIYGCDSFQQNFEITSAQDTVCFGNEVLVTIPNEVADCNTNSENTAICQGAQPFCTETGFSYSADVGLPDAFINSSYDCLFTSPNPNWFCLRINQSGSLNITLTNSNLVDVDFILLGPFSEQNAMCTEIYNQTALVQDCSYSTGATEYIDIPNAIAGQVYILLVTNFSDMPTEITLFQSGGNGSTTCNNSFENISWQGNTLNWDDGNGNAYFSPNQYGPNEYSVLATLSNGCVLSDTISIESVGPIISLVPEINTCSLPVNLNPIVQGGADYVQWSYYNNPTVLSQYNTLNTSILQQPSSNTYVLSVASYANGLYCTDSAYVVVNFVDASILVQPVSVEANLGDIVYFSCIASLGATYQWQILANGVWTNLFNAGQFSGVNTSQLSVSNVNLNNVNQQFQCVISSADGGCSDTSNIVSINFCDIASSSIPSVLNVSLNSSPNISISPITNGATYQWQSNIGFGWMNISDGLNYLGTTTPNLQIINADWQNENEWLQCVVTTNLCSDTTNICVVHITPTGIDETEAGSIYYYENAIHFSKISAALGQPYYVFDGSGKLISEGIYFGNNRIELDLQASGVYCFKLGDEILKFIKIN